VLTVKTGRIKLTNEVLRALSDRVAVERWNPHFRQTSRKKIQLPPGASAVAVQLF